MVFHIISGVYLMPKRQTKAQKYNDLANTIGQIRAGKKVKRIGRKDGSIGTKPVVPCPDALESVVKARCIEWLRKHHIMCNGHGCGAGVLEGAGYYAVYGIKDSGDIHGILKHRNGQHFELECKQDKGGTLSAGQIRRMHKVRDNGGLYYVVHGVPELEYYYNLYMERKT